MTHGWAIAVCAATMTWTGVIAGPTATAAPLPVELDQRVEASALGSDVTVAVSDGGSLVYDYDADEKQIPASTMKVVTAATSLTALGIDHRFSTRVVEGVAANVIVLVGGGDPLLSRAKVTRLAAKTARTLRKEGVKSVTVRVDDYLFPAPTDAAGWAPGDSPTYASAVRSLGFVGEYSSDTTRSVVATFLSGLQSKGVSAASGGRAVSRDDAPEIAEVKGGRLSDAIELMLRVSENNVAEVLFRHVALSQGYPATWSGGQAAAREVLQSLGLRTYRLKLIDGSGLSGKDRLTAASLTQILDRVVDPAYPTLSPIADWLPVAGRTGTLINRFNGEAACARDNVFAKTGSLTGVSTLAGITRDESGQWRSFAIMVNRRPMGYPSTSTSLAIDTIAATVNGCA